MRAAWLVAAVVLLVACAPSSGAAPAHSPTPSPSPTTTSVSGSVGAAQYRIEVPAQWNGTLFLYSHGYVAPGRINLATDSPLPLISSWLLDHGYAMAGSSYSSTGWAIEDAFKDQIAVLDLFNQRFSKPKRVIAWGGSLGGIITAGLVQTYPDRFAGAIPLCGVLAGGVATWNPGLDGAYAFKTLLAPTAQLQLVGITNPKANADLAAQVFDQAAATPQGRARIALIAALGDLTGWLAPRAGRRPRTTRVSRRRRHDGSRRSTFHSSSSTAPSWSKGPAATRRGTRALITPTRWRSRPATPR